MLHPKDLLAQYDIEPKKSLGQNFLFDPHILGKIVGAAGVTAEDHVLEVGPGLGAMTHLLAQRAARVVAVELDDRLLEILKGEIAVYPHVELVHADILDVQPTDYFAHSQNYKVVANVPYYITGAILRHLLTATHRPSKMVLTVQKDVADRIVAKPPKMSLLSTSVQFYGRPKTAFNLSSGSFYPRPKVASSVLEIDLEQMPEAARAVEDHPLFFKIVRAGFSQKRKQLLNNLKGIGGERSRVEAWCQAAEIDGKRRAETLSIDEWVRLYKGWQASV